MVTVNTKSERIEEGKCLGWPVTSYGLEYSNSSSKFNGSSRYISAKLLSIIEAGDLSNLY